MHLLELTATIISYIFNALLACSVSSLCCSYLRTQLYVHTCSIAISPVTYEQFPSLLKRATPSINPVEIKRSTIKEIINFGHIRNNYPTLHYFIHQ